MSSEPEKPKTEEQKPTLEEVMAENAKLRKANTTFMRNARKPKAEERESGSKDKNSLQVTCPECGKPFTETERLHRVEQALLSKDTKDEKAETNPEEHKHEEPSKPKEQSPPLENAIDHVINCPDCFKGTIEKLKSVSEYACKNCGLPLGPTKNLNTAENPTGKIQQ